MPTLDLISGLDGRADEQAHALYKLAGAYRLRTRLQYKADEKWSPELEASYAETPVQGVVGLAIMALFVLAVYLWLKGLN